MPELSEPHLKIAVADYDRTRPLIEGAVQVQGFFCQLTTGDLEEIFAQAFSRATYEVTELSFSNYLIATARGDCPYLALPIFPSRSFRHSAIYVRSDAGIHSPCDLHGKTIGCREYSNTASLVARGILGDEYGFQPEACQWIVGDVDHIERDAIDDRYWPKDRIQIRGVVGTSLSSLMEGGELDALIAYKPPAVFDGRAGIARLFPQWREVEQDYFRRTRRFPLMHVMAVRKDVLKRHPEVAAALLEAFSKAKDMAQARLSVHQAHPVMLPWLTAEHEQTQHLMGEDFWPYGLEKNLDIITTQIRWSFEQGLIPKRLSAEEVFVTV